MRSPTFILAGWPLILSFALASSGCAILPASAPTVTQIERQWDDAYAGFVIINIDETVVEAVSQNRRQEYAGNFISHAPAADLRIAVGNVLQISVIEVGSGIFGQSNNAATLGSETSTAQTTTLQPITVDQEGFINIPFAGRIHADGRTPRQLGVEIERLLAAKALQPQVQVSVTSSGANSATIGGEVNHPAVIPLALYGTRLLDLIAQAGGSRYPSYETNIHLTRRGRTTIASLQNIVDNPNENIYMQPKDTLYLTRDPRTFTVFGATSKVGHFPFDAVKLSLAEGIAKGGGFVEATSDPAGAFLFRYEPAAFVASLLPELEGKLEPRVPVLYRVNLREGNGYFFAQHFPMRDKDILLIADADGAQLLKALILLRGVTGVVGDLTKGQTSSNTSSPSF
jgi:polysaccharide export outer membrane protein